MPLFRYSEKDINGVTAHGVLEAVSAEQLIKDRYKRGFFVYHWREADAYIKRRPLKSRQLADFASEVSVMLSSGIPIVRALEIMASESAVSHKIRAMYAAMVLLLQRGFSVSEAMRAQGGAFPDLIASVFYSGEVSGKLSLTAQKMAEYYDKMSKLQQKTKSATAYPKFVAGLTLVIVLVLFTVVLPKFLESNDTQESALPAITRVMMRISQFITQQYLLIALTAGSVVFLFIFLSRIPAYRALVGRIYVGFPVIGKYMKMIYTARFSATLSNLYTSGVALSQALETAVKTIGNDYVALEFNKCRADIARGKSLSAAVRHMTGLSPRMYQVLAVGEETGKLGEVLESMGSAFDSEVDTALAKLIAIISPVLLIVMTAVIGLVMAGIMLPLMNSYQQM